jgi:hypothetical protein
VGDAAGDPKAHKRSRTGCLTCRTRYVHLRLDSRCSPHRNEALTWLFFALLFCPQKEKVRRAQACVRALRETGPYLSSSSSPRPSRACPASEHCLQRHCCLQSQHTCALFAVPSWRSTYCTGSLALLTRALYKLRFVFFRSVCPESFALCSLRLVSIHRA